VSDSTVRLQAYLARAGVASRRASEDLIRDGKVEVNGVVAELGMSVDGSRDVVEVEGRVITPQRVQWIAVHKPKGYVTTRDDPEGRKTVYDLLPDNLRHLFHVGRLDRDSSGLLLLTNDGEAANRLLHPRYGTTKEYWADVDGEPEAKDLRLLVRGVQLDDGLAKAESMTLRDEVKPGIFRIAVVMKEGRRREVRRMLESIGHPVRRLFRRRFGPIEIGKLPPGEWRYLTAEELESLVGRPARPASGAPQTRPRQGGRGGKEPEQGRGPRRGRKRR
jgi:23S rRNA pseudouridine2605 synthase